ncbi:NnrS family protein [Sulfuriflexus mobilis]|uniref:NnrS family protein n=1 Tax=Sulfuriflexus mobilis TaxID=1811807 RepID=UPI000F833775|nr:NnrS family protein [Sulfuriflexus mobilis]
MQIEEARHYRIGFQHLGFRPFFLLASILAVVSIGGWLWILTYQGHLPASLNLSPVSWHAHEMLYGYVVAVIAGFLLTAERNWTGVQTLHGMPLLLLAVLWLLARLMPFMNTPQSLLFMAAFDLMFNAGLCLALLYPIVKVRQWQHLAIWSKVLLLLVGNILFYLGAVNELDDGIRLGLYTALYLIVSLIMLMGRRVIPFFIEKGVDQPVSLVNHRWLDLTSLALMLAFIIVEVFVVSPMLAAITAAALAVLHAWRLVGWYSNGIWSKPLLWSLYLGYAWLVAGFALKALSYWSTVNPMLAIHAFAYGGVGMITLGMMARITLGHTGRDVFTPPRVMPVLFLLLFSGAFIRVVMPILTSGSYAMWIMLSQLLWMAAFTGFVLVYAPMLVKGRVDGKYG